MFSLEIHYLVHDVTHLLETFGIGNGSKSSRGGLLVWSEDFLEGYVH